MESKIKHGINGRLFQINISDGGVPKNPVRKVKIRASGLEGDRQRNLEHHGGPNRAVLLYSLERILALQAEGHPIYPGAIGENITVAGLDWVGMVPGKRLRLGDQVVLEITNFPSPCGKLVDSFIQGEFKRVDQELYPGWSRVGARVLQEGEVCTGDPIQLID